MPVVEHRPLTDEERASLRSLSRDGAERLIDFWLVMVVFALAYVPASWLLGKLGVRDSVWRWLLFGVALGAGLAFLWRLRKDRARFQAWQTADLEDGRATVATYEVTDAIRVEELEDEGSQYYLRLADGGVLFLRGQYLDEEEEDGLFPSTRFRTVRSTPNGNLLDFEVLGEPLAPSGTRPAFTIADHEAGRVPDDGEVLEVDFEALRPEVQEPA